MKALKTLGVGIFTIMLVICSLLGLDYVFSDDTKSWSRVEMHELYEQEKIDSLFVGASHVYSGIDPAITDQIWNQNTFNCSTSAQRYDTSFMLLKEANRVADIDTCYFEISWKGAVKELEDATLPPVCTVSDYLRFSWDKVAYMLKAVQTKDYMNAFCRARRNWKNIYSWDKIKETVSKKEKDTYKNYGPIRLNSGYYARKGFLDFEGEFNNVATSVIKSIEEPVSEDFQECLLEMAQYCRENDIELVCFSAPLPEYTLESIGNYDVYYSAAKELCEEADISYYDFNLANSSVLDIGDSDFRDRTHLNGAGARKLTTVFANFFAGKIREEELFYESYAEKREHVMQRFIGMALRRDASAGTCEIVPIATKEDDYQYEIYYEDENKNYVLIQEKSPNLIFAMPQKGKTRLKVRVYDSEGEKVFGIVKSV